MVARAWIRPLGQRLVARLVVRPVFLQHSVAQTSLYSRQRWGGCAMSTAAPARRGGSTLGPDAANPTHVSNPVHDKTGQTLRINVTESAATKLKSVAAAENRPELILRIHVESGGCHGFQYVFQLQDRKDITDNDSVFERNDAQVVIDHRSLRVLRDATVDYATELIGSQFKVTSPHTSSSCGCGSSFSLEDEP